MGGDKPPIILCGGFVTSKERKVGRLAQAILKDQAIKNRLNDFETQYKEPDITVAIELAIGRINTEHAIRSYIIDDVPESLLAIATAVQLLSSEISLKTRNSMAVNDGEMNINREGNLDAYRVLYQHLDQRFSKLCYNFITTKTVQSAMYVYEND